MIFEFKKDYDVVVAGAGIAGIAAALAAARRGHKTALIEKQILIGGLATSGLIYIYLPLCDGEGTQVTFGIAEELLKASLEFSPFDLPEKWGGPKNGRCFRTNRYECDFSPAGFTLTLDRLLLEAGVDLWLDTRVCAVQKAADGKITAVEVENSSGRGVVSAKYFVDASGEAILIRRAGGKTETDQNFRALWMIERAPGGDLPYAWTDSIHVQALGSQSPDFQYQGDPRDARAATGFVRESWRMGREHYRNAWKSEGSDRFTRYPLHLPAMPQFRKIARIRGLETLTTGSEWDPFASSVGIYADWRRAGKVYETPYGSLIPEDVRGVFAAGRCISAEGDAWESYRVIPSAAMTGEIAGTAASLAVERGCDGTELTPDQVRAELRKNGFKFHFEEVGLDPAERKKRGTDAVKKTGDRSRMTP